ncbi:unnamed protein product [Porites evermanni]|uniref:UPAR/Ly6 domain-containing protein n=1 Tax=Porites evermanni TaxID=104178 RepID=A0ABN8QIG5_9CNID|nr:unnamed protein product [Porites evermanni]
MKILFGLAFLLCISVGYALKCNQCLFTKSWDDCKNNTEEVSCSDSDDRCVKFHIKAETSGVTDEVFAKGCTTSSKCREKNCKKFAPSAKITKCEVNCCKGDLCNGAQVPMVSAIMLLACAIVGFAR